MANTYTQIYIHVVFAVEGRQSLIKTEHNDELQKYITGIVSAQKQKLIVINNMPDHLHLLIGLKPDASLSSLVRDVKAGSSKFINEKRWVAGRFSWQEGFGAFSYSRSQLGTVIRYIENQQKHHAKKSFREEYGTLLEKFSGIRPAIHLQTARRMISQICRPDGAKFSFGIGFLQRCRADGAGLQLWKTSSRWKRRNSGSGSANFSGKRIGLPSKETKFCSSAGCGKKLRSRLLRTTFNLSSSVMSPASNAAS